MDTLCRWLAFFFVYSLLGWLWETLYVSLRRGRLVNRGFLYGPFLPLYGFGAMFLLLAVLPLKGHPGLVFLAGLVSATALELFTGWAMERLFCVRYWDYSAHRFQFRGYIWLVSSLFWGLLSVLLVEGLHERVRALVRAPGAALLRALVALISVGFALDLCLSLREALRLRGLLLETQRLRLQLQQLRRELEEHMDEHYLAAREQLSQRREQLGSLHREHQQARRRQLQQRLSALQAQHERQLNKIATLRTRLHRRHPSLRLLQLEGALRELRERHKEE